MPARTDVYAVKRKYESRWLAIEGVVSVDVMFLEDGSKTLSVAVSNDGSAARTGIGEKVEGVHIEFRKADRTDQDVTYAGVMDQQNAVGT